MNGTVKEANNKAKAAARKAHVLRTARDANEKAQAMAFERHRDKNGQMRRKHGNTLISTLRKHYGTDFAYGCADSDTLGDIPEGLMSLH